MLEGIRGIVPRYATPMGAPDQPPTASIVILTRHNPRRISRCLAALARLPDGVSHEVVVLLNGADHDVRAALATPPVRILDSSVNLGFAGGCNWASAATTGRYLVFLNDDTEVEAGWLQSLVEVADTSADIGAVGSCVLFPDRSVQEAGAIVWQDGSVMALGRGQRPDAPPVSFVRRVDYCSACSLLVRREAWTAAGGFNEDYFPAYYEDVDFCVSLRMLGYSVVYAPDSRVIHDGGSSTEPRYRRFLNDYHKQRFRERWGRVLNELEPANPKSPAAVRRATFRASGCLRRLLVIAGRIADAANDSERDRIREAVVELSDAGYAVSVWTPGDASKAARELGAFGVETVGGPLEEHLHDPGVLYDAVLVSEPCHFDRFKTLVRNDQPHSVLIYDADTVHHQPLARRASLAGGAEATVHAAEALAMRALETGIRAHADFLTCASSNEARFFCSTAGSAPIAVVPHSPRDARFGQCRHGTARSRRTRGVWTEVVRQALSARDARRSYPTPQST